MTPQKSDLAAQLWSTECEIMNVIDNLDVSVVFESEYYCGGKLFDEPRGPGRIMHL